jgi:hypothetical protein
MEAEMTKQPGKPGKPGDDRVHGEGNYEAAREYGEATRDFVRSGRVDEAARAAEPSTESQRRDLEEAERAGAARAKEEDPALRGGGGPPARPGDDAPGRPRDDVSERPRDGAPRGNATD